MIRTLKIVTFFILMFSTFAFAETPYINEIPKEFKKEGIVIASHNAFNLGRAKMEKHPKAIRAMAKMYRNADIVLVQEVSTSDSGAFAVAMLAIELNEMGAKWNYKVSDPTSGPGTERFGFLWNTSRVAAIPEEAFLSTSLRDDFDREPAYMHFVVDGKKFTVVSFHLQPKDKETGKDPRIEINALAKKPSEFMIGPMIFAGDFNTNYKTLDMAFHDVLKADHCIDGKTSLKTKLDKKGNYLKNAFDNVYVRGMTVVRSVILDFVPNMDSLKQARKMSDHFPVIVVVRP